MGGSENFHFLDAVATVDVLTASNNDVNFVETQTVHFAWLLSRRFVLREWTKSNAISRIGKFYLLFAPWITTWHCFYPINLKARAKMVGIVNNAWLCIAFVTPRFLSPVYTVSSRNVLHGTMIPILWLTHGKKRRLAFSQSRSKGKRG